MKKKFLLLCFFISCSIYSLKAQNSAYMLSPKWMVGHFSGMNFVSGTNTIIDPVNMGGNPANNSAQEATSTVCMPDKNIALYCNNYQVYGVTNGLITTVNNPLGGYSSTEGAITLPDPATAGDYYVFAGNDQTGGTKLGINWYRIRKAGTTYTILSGPNNIAGPNDVNEGTAVSSDGNGGYWVVSHTQAFPHEYWSWHVTTTGVGPKVVSPSACRGGIGAGGSISISKCQNRIALIGALEVEVCNWNMTTGQATPFLFSGLGNVTGSGYSGDFSPNGNVYYYAGLNDQLKQWDLSQPWSTGVINVTGATGVNGVHLGPNNKVYVAHGISNVISSINNPNNVGDAACGYQANALTLTQTDAIRVNMANISWLNPQRLTPRIDTVGTIGNCTDKTFSIFFPNYFGDEIAKQNATILWDWGHGGLTTSNNVNPTHTFPNSGGPYTVTLSFKDVDGCQTWTNTISIPIICPAPVELLGFNASAKENGVLITWQTAMELGNDRFVLLRSEDGVHFEPITSIKGAGNSSALLSYKYYDEEVTYSKVYYYRLDQHDFDGTMSSSKIVVVQLAKNNLLPFTVSPNPFSSSFVLNKSINEAATISVYDILGRLLEQKISGAEDKTHVLGENLSNGSYLVKYISNTNSYTLHIEKK